MKIERSSGALLHITSLDGDYGIGTLGKEAELFAETLNRMGMKYWQILPIGPVSKTFGYSPYASPSTFAGNYHFISLQKLAEQGWFSGSLDETKKSDDHFVLFEDALSYKDEILKQAYDNFFFYADHDTVNDFELFCKEQIFWLHDFALFSALSEEFETTLWTKWDKDIAQRNKEAINTWSEKLEKEIRFHKFVQYIFFSQWYEFKEQCNQKGISIIGDIPIYITLESADAWAHPEILQIDTVTGKPTVIAGVPPDYFSETGQRWGNPIYSWFDENKNIDEATFFWWAKRINHLHKLMDIVRIDHFRGFEAYWAIPFKEKTAINGEWVKGPDLEFFLKLKEELGDLPLIAEDLGVITPEVEKLRDKLSLPGMRILQFAFDWNNKNIYLPHNVDIQNCILYTGTHDNNTTNGWFYGDEIDDGTRKYILEYLGVEGEENFNWHLIKQAFRSVANLIIIPAQDILGYGENFRMNTPGTTEGNWGWKLTKDVFTEEIKERLHRMGKIYRRLPEDKNLTE